MKFQFRLEGLMRQRRSIEQAKMRVMIEAQNALEHEQQQLNQLYKSIDEARDQRFNGEGGGNIGSASYIESFIDGQKVRIEVQKEVIRERQMDFEQAQEHYRKAAIALKTIEKLKEKKLEEFRKEKMKREEKRVDEMIAVRHNRRVGL